MLERKGVPSRTPVLIRIFKQESELELWMQKHERFELVATYPVCFWSGKLGPKLREGDRQAPEGVYSISVSQINHRGRLPRSSTSAFPIHSIGLTRVPVPTSCCTVAASQRVASP
jgi:murein L,D-transpeptidase YafK